VRRCGGSSVPVITHLLQLRSSSHDKPSEALDIQRKAAAHTDMYLTLSDTNHHLLQLLSFLLLPSNSSVHFPSPILSLSSLRSLFIFSFSFPYHLFNFLSSFYPRPPSSPSCCPPLRSIPPFSSPFISFSSSLLLGNRGTTPPFLT
jgi:hypothetical protein